MNPWLILAAVLALAGAGAWGEMDGRARGHDAQAVADAKTIKAAQDTLQNARDLATKVTQAAEEHVIDDERHKAEIHQEMERQHELDQAATDAHRRELAGRSLRVAVDLPAGSGCGGQVRPAADPAGAGASTVVQLPDVVARDLRQLALEADRLADEHRKCLWYEGAVTDWLKANP